MGVKKRGGAPVKFLQKHWYVCFSVLAFYLLAASTILQCLIPRKGYSIWLFRGGFGITMLLLLLSLPFFLIFHLVANTVIAFILLYVSGVFYTYLLILWREKYLKQLMKKTKKR